jgi:hypothetical protein
MADDHTEALLKEVLERVLSGSNDSFGRDTPNGWRQNLGGGSWSKPAMRPMPSRGGRRR